VPKRPSCKKKNKLGPSSGMVVTQIFATAAGLMYYPIQTVQCEGGSKHSVDLQATLHLRHFKFHAMNAISRSHLNWEGKIGQQIEYNVYHGSFHKHSGKRTEHTTFTTD